MLNKTAQSPQDASGLTAQNPLLEKKGIMQLFLWGLVAAILVWSWQGAEMNPYALWEYRGNMAEMMGDFFPPNFHDWDFYVDEMLTTIQIAIWGTLLSVILAIPFGILSSENIAPWWVYQPMPRN